MNRLLRDERLAPRYAFMLQMLAMHQDSEGETEKSFFEEAFRSIFSEVRALKRSSPDDPLAADTQVSRLDLEAVKVGKDYVNEYLKKTIVTPEEES